MRACERQEQGPYKGRIKVQLGTGGVRLNAGGAVGAAGETRYEEVLR
jgi:hypothetical protein